MPATYSSTLVTHNAAIIPLTYIYRLKNKIKYTDVRQTHKKEQHNNIATENGLFELGSPMGKQPKRPPKMHREKAGQVPRR